MSTLWDAQAPDAAFPADAAFPSLGFETHSPHTVPLIFAEVLLLVFCEFGSCSDFVARKLCHAGAGLLMLFLDPADPLSRYFVYTVVISSLFMVWEVGVIINQIINQSTSGVTSTRSSKPTVLSKILCFRFRYSDSRDVGITVYLLVVGMFFYTQTTLRIIQPVFFADPAGAIVGKFVTRNAMVPWNRTWIGEKTVGGTMAVFVVGFLSLTFGTMFQKLILAAILAAAEGVSRNYDNLLIFVVVMAGWLVLGKPSV